MFNSIAQTWFDTKEQFELSSQLSTDAIHANIGVGLFLFFSLFVRRGRWLIVPWLTLLGLELMNEFFDMNSVNFENGWSDSIHDFFNTMTLPTVLMFLMKYRERPWARKWSRENDRREAEQRQAEASKSSDALEQAGDEALK